MADFENLIFSWCKFCVTIQSLILSSCVAYIFFLYSLNIKLIQI